MVDNGNLLKEVSDMDISDIFNEIDRHRPADLENGGYRNIPRDKAAKYQELVRDAFPTNCNVIPFGYDWLGRIFAVNAELTVKMYDVATDEIFEIVNIRNFKTELAEHANVLIASEVYDEWLQNGGAKPESDHCIGFKTPLFLGGKDEFDNYELSDIDVYWTLTGQLKNTI